MNKFLPVLLILNLSSVPVFAEDVGINFDTMIVGTKLTTTSMGYVEETYIAEYIGSEDGFFLIQNHKLLEDGSTKALNVARYDDKGRLVSSSLDGKTNTYSPYSCHYVVGECIHTYKYYNWGTKKYVTNERKFENRLDADTLYIGVIQSDGDKFEVPYLLGPHRLRLSSNYKDALGTQTGHVFVELVDPE